MLGLAAITLGALCALVLLGLPVVISLVASVLMFLASVSYTHLTLPTTPYV